jgi:SpoVK/Ycf46/Vps4 family AAA+-type ATPase|nr:ATP-binding protein [Neorhizobium tomejilense]
MLKDYPILEALLSSGFSGDRDGFRSNLDLMEKRAAELGDVQVGELVKKVSRAAERGWVEDRTNDAEKKAAFSRTLGSVDDIPPGIMMLKTNVTMNEVILSENVKIVIREFLEEQQFNEKYIDNGLEPRNKAMLIGPPGNGKTETTKAIANFMKVPLYYVRYDELVSKQPGETQKRLNRVFNFSKTHRCLLFFDEIDAIAKDRGGEGQTGEMQSVVSTLLVQLEDVPPHVMVLAATNHPEMIDKAMWRRFHIRVNLPNPMIDQFVEYLAMKFKVYKIEPKLDLRILAYQIAAENFAETSVFVDDCVRTWVRNDKNISIEEAIQRSVVTWPKNRVKIAT